MAFIGIDTSNYTTSCALAEDGIILSDYRQLLSVKPGSVGLRQSDALYQHWENLPRLLEALFADVKKHDVRINGIVVSTRPRPQEASYMPVFNAGKNVAYILSNALNIPVIESTHQEGHIYAAAYGNDVDFHQEILCAHLSGGTLELVTIKDSKISIIGGTRDISYGQILDRCGVLLGYSFPAGKYIDELAMNYKENIGKSPFKKVFCKGSEINLSGLETQVKNAVNEGLLSKEAIAYYLMSAISDSFIEIIKNSGINQVLITGGVSSSKFLRRSCESMGYMFGKADLCSDNACGLALSEGKSAW